MQDFQKQIKDSLSKAMDAEFGKNQRGAEGMTALTKMKSALPEQKGKKKKKENKEATGSSSAGGFAQPLGRVIKRENLENKLKGGLSDGKNLKDLSKKHSVSIDTLKKQLKKGISVEKEHTSDGDKAKEIAMDHISENPKYYDELKKAGIDEKWSDKYKRSIDCENPKGFSQKAHCQGRKKKTETKEATGAGSSGSYETPAAWAKSTSKKDWRGASKTQIPGGKFVKVKKKCTKYPYCNQGDINALRLFDNKLVETAIKNVSKKHNVSEKLIRDILSEQFDKIVEVKSLNSNIDKEKKK